MTVDVLTSLDGSTRHHPHTRTTDLDRMTLPQEGVLSEHSIEELMLAAAATRLRGLLVVDGSERTVLYFSRGFVAHLTSDAAAVSGADKVGTELRMAQHIGRLIAVDEGTFQVIESNQVPPAARWLFPVERLLKAARALGAPPPEWSPMPNGGHVRLRRSISAPIELTPEEWAVVAALAVPQPAGQLAVTLGWNQSAVERTLDGLVAREAAEPADAGRSADVPHEVVEPPHDQQRVASDVPQNPRVRASALRRLIKSL